MCVEGWGLTVEVIVVDAHADTFSISDILDMCPATDKVVAQEHALCVGDHHGVGRTIEDRVDDTDVFVRFREVKGAVATCKVDPCEHRVATSKFRAVRADSRFL